MKNFSKKSRTVPKKIKRGDPLTSTGFVGYVKVKNGRGTLWRQKKIQKKSHSAEKNQKGGSLVPSGFVGYLEKVLLPDPDTCYASAAGDDPGEICIMPHVILKKSQAKPKPGKTTRSK